jgi:hypothetical protein
MELCSLARQLFSDDRRIPPGIPITLAEPAKNDPFEERLRLKGGQPPHWLVLAPEAKTRLLRLFGRFGLDLGQLRFALRVLGGQAQGLNYGDTIYLYPRFGRGWYDEQLGLLAHEITHAVQYRKLGRAALALRHARERQRSGGNLYDPAPKLTATPIADVDPVTPDYYLEQLAERFRQAVTFGK